MAVKKPKPEEAGMMTDTGHLTVLRKEILDRLEMANKILLGTRWAALYAAKVHAPIKERLGRIDRISPEEDTLGDIIRQMEVRR